ncbi:MAG TPA: branched-chain amino acid aminotransferase [Firmicutes bacterium]|nr:branched-chain amino acid aminotransferase [Bacillota bacterium]HBK67790.1 branched-chain amino acid aminotransferase [Bacillota bacterium]
MCPNKSAWATTYENILEVRKAEIRTSFFIKYIKIKGENFLEIYIDGQFYPKNEAKVSVFDHGLLYGDGIFEGTRAYNGRIFQFDEHINRLFDSAKAIALEIPMSKEEVKTAHLETLRRNKLTDAYIRTVVTRGVGDLGLDPRKCAKATVIIIADRISLYPQELYEQGLKIITVPTRRNLPETVNPMIKSLNYLNNILAKIEANLSGASEAIMLNQEGYVAECTGDNIFIVKGKTIATPAVSFGALKGITRGVVMKLASEMGLEVRETALTRYDVYVADECFLTGTAAEVIPVVEVDGRKIATGAPGVYSKKLKEAFHQYAMENGTPIY